MRCKASVMHFAIRQFALIFSAFGDDVEAGLRKALERYEEREDRLETSRSPAGITKLGLVLVL